MTHITKRILVTTLNWTRHKDSENELPVQVINSDVVYDGPLCYESGWTSEISQHN